MWQLISTCQHLHDKNVIHRDLKLGNLFLKQMSIKVGDFGLATRLDHPEERKRTICGTPNYIAPEILDNRNGHSFEVDTWSIGVILYTMLIGKPPFETPSVKTTYKKIRANIYSFPDSVEISREAEQLITSILHSTPEMRPSLEQIRRHPFFTKNTFPARLSISALTTPTVWKADSHGKRGEDVINAALGGNGGRRAPLTDRTNSKNTRMASGKTLRDSRKDKENVALPESKHVRAYSSSSGGSNAGDRRDSKRDSRKAEVAPSTLKPSETEKDKFVPFDGKASVKEGDLKHVGVNEDDRRHFKQLHDDIEISFVNKKPSAPAISNTDFHNLISNNHDSKAPAPKSSGGVLHVNKWLDFSKKYGLGYLLSNGNAGVYFNDSSKIVLQKDTSAFEYIERRSSSGRGGQTKQFTLNNYPSDLEKKVTLLKHFQQYLKQKADADPSTVFTPSDTGSSEGEMVYVKKWLRTRHAILFRLSNRTVQVIFFDKTQVVLSSNARSVTYVDKYNIKMVYPLDCIFDVPRPDLSKRMKYIKDVMYYLFSRSKYPGATK
jgi:polo-like kinase 1